MTETSPPQVVTAADVITPTMADQGHVVGLARVPRYDVEAIAAALPPALFALISPRDRVVLKPNWVLEGHKDRPEEWEHVITHPALITAVLRRVLGVLEPGARVSIIDGPTTEASFTKLIARYPVEEWKRIAARRSVDFEIIDLRDVEYETSNDIIIGRRSLPGDPRGKTEAVLLGAASEFHGHRRSRRGYHGADYDRAETNRAHDGHRNLYSVSRTVMECDVFINLPKLKTHRKAGITCCLKNLVGINTYKNYLPHHSEGGPSEGGDQFPKDNVNARVEGPLLGFLKQHVLRRSAIARRLAPLNSLGRKVFGDTKQVIRSGNWYGNDTIWRMILDLNKVLMFADADGRWTRNSPRTYIGIVDAIAAGEGHGPLAPDRVDMGYVLWGTNPVAIDHVASMLMGFVPARIPSISNAFRIAQHPLVGFAQLDIAITIEGACVSADRLPRELIVPFRPQFGWVGHIEAMHHESAAAS